MRRTSSTKFDSHIDFDSQLKLWWQAGGVTTWGGPQSSAGVIL
jgi:hypothetical protein